MKDSPKHLLCLPRLVKDKHPHQRIPHALGEQAASKWKINQGKKRGNASKSQAKNYAIVDRKRNEERLLQRGTENSVKLFQGWRNTHIQGNMFLRKLHCGFCLYFKGTMP
jgi:hypothetical protein